MALTLFTLVTTGAGGLMVIVSEVLPVPNALLAEIVTGKLPACVGGPLNSPALESVSPFGKLPAVTLKLYGALPPAALMLCA